MRNVQTSGRDFELVEHDSGLLLAGFILRGHDDGGRLEGDHRIEGLIGAGDAIEMGFELTGDRRGAIDQGTGRPVDGKKDGNIVQHDGALSGCGPDKSCRQNPEAFLIYLMAPNGSAGGQSRTGPRRCGRDRE